MTEKYKKVILPQLFFQQPKAFPGDRQPHLRSHSFPPTSIHRYSSISHQDGLAQNVLQN